MLNGTCNVQMCDAVYMDDATHFWVMHYMCIRVFPVIVMEFPAFFHDQKMADFSVTTLNNFEVKENPVHDTIPVSVIQHTST